MSVTRRVRMIVLVTSSSCRLPVRGFEAFCEDRRDSRASSTSPIVVLPSSEEFREDTGWYFDVSTLGACSCQKEIFKE